MAAEPEIIVEAPGVRLRALSRGAELHQHWLSAPQLPTLYLHGADDGCASADYANWVQRVPPEDSGVAKGERAGHFLQLERPEAGAGHIIDFIGAASA
ncbi:alpha/beta hydrolase [Mycobacterium sp. 1164985.4]|uniref:alpha/beta fold hydrolase n=1 Tax=Mycobacterium sp. 1164985.4 TaxID=1834069 RepID=UPI0007FC782E|nr:hypothetical protein A5650_18650 [Mycobacterium sp. 1164985.4]